MTDKSKGIPNKPTTDLLGCCKSTFTLTFIVEILGLDVWHDCNEGWLDLGPCVQAMKIQYSLYHGQNYDLDVLIWPHVAKLWCGLQYGYVRSWQFLERRWIAFSIRHAFPVRVNDLQDFVASVTLTQGVGALSANAKNDKTFEVYLRSLQFGEPRYFAPVFENEPTLYDFVRKTLWNRVKEKIPASHLDGEFDVPGAVIEKRHQDTAIDLVQEIILNNKQSDDEDSDNALEIQTGKKAESKTQKEKDKKKPEVKTKLEITLSGDAILAGTGRVIPFETVGERPADLGEIKVLLSSDALPAPDDCPIIFVNVEQIFNVPVETLKKLRIFKIYTRWNISSEVHSAEPQVLLSKPTVKINDHHAVTLPLSMVPDITSSFIEDPFEIQLRGIRLAPNTDKTLNMFGFSKNDQNFGKFSPLLAKPQEDDILIAVTKIDARKLAKRINTFIRGEFPFYPPTVSVVDSEREPMCTNDINAIKRPVKPEIVVQPYIVIENQMSLDMSIGFVGCKTQLLNPCYSRMYCLVDDSELAMTIIRMIADINDELSLNDLKDNILTGFAIDTGNVVLIFVEGHRDGSILRLWDAMGEFYPKVKPVFASCSRYSIRIYKEFLTGNMPFRVIKMFVPLGVLLACPPVYVRPALPVLVRSAVLKLGRILGTKLETTPYRSDMPTTEELNSFMLELGVPPTNIGTSICDATVTRISRTLS